MAKYPIDGTTQINLHKGYARKLYPSALKQAFATFKKDMSEEEKKEPYRVKALYIKTSDLGDFRSVMDTVDSFKPSLVPLRKLEEGSDEDCFELFFEFEKIEQPKIVWSDRDALTVDENMV